VKNRLPPTRRPRTPAEQMLACGRVSPDAELLVSFVDSDEEGNLRLVEYVAERQRAA
jgi:hypothetical protein